MTTSTRKFRRTDPPLAQYHAVWPTKHEIRSARLAARLTQQRAADTVAVHRVTWQRWERGVSAMPIAAWRLLLIATGQLARLERFAKPSPAAGYALPAPEHPDIDRRREAPPPIR